MIFRRVSSAATIVLFLAVGALYPAAAQNAVGLVLGVKGATSPAIEPPHELRAGDTIVLLPGAEMEFVQYLPPCRTLIVEGGSVTFSGGRFQYSDSARIVVDKPGGCPKVVSLVKSSVTGGERIRVAGDQEAKLSARPGFALIGRSRNSVANLAVRRDGAEIYRRRLSGHRAGWPLDRRPLDPGVYVLDLVSEGGAIEKSVAFEVSPVAGSQRSLMLIKLD